MKRAEVVLKCTLGSLGQLLSENFSASDQGVTKPSIISLFTGAGGLDLGFHAAGLSTAVAVEMDARCCKTLRANESKHPWQVIEQPVEEVSSEEILQAGKLKAGKVDVLIGGPPCQPFSKSGFWSRGEAGRLDDPRANTLSEYMRVLCETQPKAFLLENVAGLAFSGKEEGFQYLLDEVKRINLKTNSNYQVHWKVINAASYGVPQTRERIILIGSRDGADFTFPAPQFFDANSVEAGESFRTAWDAIGDLDCLTAPEETVVSGRWADLLPSIPEGMNYLHHTDRGAGIALFGWRRRYWSFLLKLAKSRPSWTLTAQPGPAIGPFHWKSRRLTRQELARLQTIPDGYAVEGTLTDVQRQLGNAVPSLLGEILGTEIRRQLLGHNIPMSRPRLLCAKRADMPAAEQSGSVPRKFKSLEGIYEAHPGTGLGFGALRRQIL